MSDFSRFHYTKDQKVVFDDPIDRRCPWREASGFSIDVERNTDSFGRRRYLKALFITVGLRIAKVYDAQQSGELDGDFTPHWTPIPGICFDLGIAPSLLNRLLKEYSGLTAQQICERQRCFKLDLDRQLAGEIARFIRARFVPGSNPDTGTELDLHAQHLDFWRAWREHRKSTIGWSNADWAAQYGFTSYTKFHRAFTLAFGKSPIQHEAQTMREAALYFRAAHSLRRRYEWQKNNPPETYPQDANSFDHYVQLRSENPNWWSRQYERYGMALDLRGLASQINKGAAKFDLGVCEDPFTVCTRETKIAESNRPPSTPANNPWPNAQASGEEPAVSGTVVTEIVTGYPTTNCTQFGVGELREQEAAPGSWQQMLPPDNPDAPPNKPKTTVKSFKPPTRWRESAPHREMLSGVAARSATCTHNRFARQKRISRRHATR